MKAPNKLPLANAEWSFHKIPETEHRAAWLWELDRSLGSGGEPWIALHDDIKQRVALLVPGAPQPVLEEYNLARATPEFVHRFETSFHEIPKYLSHSIGHHQLHLLHVDWSCSETKILRELGQWVKKQLKAVPAETARKIDKGGRKNQFAAWFTDLAIYRASEAGIVRAEAVRILRPLLANSMGSTQGKTSPSHWEDAQKKSRKRLINRMVELEARVNVLQQQAGDDVFPRTWRGLTLAGILLRRQSEFISSEYEATKEAI